MKRKSKLEMSASPEILEKKAIQVSEEGHPLYLLSKDNEIIDEKLIDLIESVENDEDFNEIYKKLEKIQRLKRHYQIKASFLYPFMVKYGTAGPSGIMWEIDDEIKGELKTLYSIINKDNYSDLKSRLLEVLEKARDMVFKEEKILIPNSELVLSQGDFYEIYNDLSEFEFSFIDLENMPKWQRADLIKRAIDENKTTKTKEKLEEEIEKDYYIKMEKGKLSVDEVKAIFETFPFEITFIDKDNINSYFSSITDIFPRAESAIGRNVKECHPPKAIERVEMMLNQFETKQRREFIRYDNKNGMKILVRYYGVYDEKDNYVGTLELVEDMSKYLDSLNKLK